MNEMGDTEETPLKDIANELSHLSDATIEIQNNTPNYDERLENIEYRLKKLNKIMSSTLVDIRDVMVAALITPNDKAKYYYNNLKRQREYKEYGYYDYSNPSQAIEYIYKFIDESYDIKRKFDKQYYKQLLKLVGGDKALHHICYNDAGDVDFVGEIERLENKKNSKINFHPIGTKRNK